MADTASIYSTGWAQEFIAAAEDGHAGKTMQIVRALTIRSTEDDEVPPEVAEAADLDTLLGSLAGEGSPVGRNRLVREWLAVHRATILVHWAELGLPVPPMNAPEPEAQQAIPSDLRSEAPGLAIGGGDPGRCGGVIGVARSRGLVVFDFDLTLAAKNVGIFDLEDCVNRSFGGAKRVAMLQTMLQRLSDSGLEMVVLTFNSSHTVRKALGPRPGCGLLALLRGNKTNAETIIGCEDYTDEERSKHGRAEMCVKSAVISSRWIKSGLMQASHILFVVRRQRFI